MLFIYILLAIRNITLGINGLNTATVATATSGIAKFLTNSI